MGKHLLLALLVLAAALPRAAWAKAASVKAPALKAWGSADELRETVYFFISAAGDNRSPGSAGNTRALEWLKKKAFEVKGWSVEARPFKPDTDFAIKGYKKDFEKLRNHPKDNAEYVKWKFFTDSVIQYQESLRPKTGVNLVLSKKGSNPKLAKQVVVVGAHFDTITHNSTTMVPTPDLDAPGADDNGAAVMALLSLAHRLKDVKPSRTLELVFFDFEEAFFLGSRAYAEELRKKSIDAELVNLEMIGWDYPVPKAVKLYVRSEGQPRHEKDFAIASRLYDKLKREGLDVKIAKTNHDRSDQWSFWNAFHSGAMVSQDWERNFNEGHYHTPRDTPETVNWPLVEKIINGVEKAVREMVR